MFSLVALGLKLAVPGEMSRQVSLNPGDLLYTYLYPYENAMRELWFIAVLMWMFVLAPVWKVSLKKDWSVAVTVAALIVLHFVHPMTDLLCIRRAFVDAIWFYLGIVAFKYDLIEGFFSRYKVPVLLAGVAVYLIGMKIDSAVVTLGGILLSIGLALLLDKYIPKTFFSFRKYTYQIFLIGIFAQMFVKILHRHIDAPYILMYLLCIAMGLYVPVIFSKILEKINWQPLLMCVGLKKR